MTVVNAMRIISQLYGRRIIDEATYELLWQALEHYRARHKKASS